MAIRVTIILIISLFDVWSKVAYLYGLRLYGRWGYISEMKVVEKELLDNRIEESGIFLIWAGRPIMINSVLEGLRQSRLDDIH